MGDYGHEPYACDWDELGEPSFHNPPKRKAPVKFQKQNNTTMKTLCIFSGYVAGVSFAKPNMSYVQPDEEVALVLEPHNQYDPQAIRVGGPQKLGYVPREACFSIHHANAGGFQPVAQIVEVSETKYKEILVRVFVEVKE